MYINQNHYFSGGKKRRRAHGAALYHRFFGIGDDSDHPTHFGWVTKIPKTQDSVCNTALFDFHVFIDLFADCPGLFP
jgi:hypothetical protein